MLFFSFCHCFQPFRRLLTGISREEGEASLHLQQGPLRCFNWTRSPADVFIGITQDVLLEGILQL